MKVYVAGPITVGNQFYNMRNAFEAADQLLTEGHTPFVPHATCMWDMMFPHDYEEWIRYDDEWLCCCDAVVRTPGESSGADRECIRAEALGIPVYHGLESFLAASAG